jgi:ABC-type branched-subunit amino acid transport system substrate-binding protein
MRGEDLSHADMVNINADELNAVERYLYTLLHAVLAVNGRNFKDAVLDLRPILNDAKMLNQQVSSINLCVTTRKEVREYLRNTIRSTGFFNNLAQRFALTHLF